MPAVWSNGRVSTPWRCSGASLADAEPMAATAPTDERWLLVEHQGPWGRQAVVESRLPLGVRSHLAALAEQGVRVQLIRRPGSLAGPSAPGGRDAVTVLAADLAGGAPVVRRGLLRDAGDLVGLDVAELPLTDDPLWLVCTNGSRDVCCAATGRPVAAALAQRWPEATWETTHLGGHRFAGTLLALPSGVTLGRLGAASAVAAAEAVLAGRLPPGLVRGRAGHLAPAQAAEHHLRVERGLDHLDAVRVVAVEPDRVHLEVGAESGPVAVAVEVAVEQRPGPPRRQSCADETTKATARWSCRTLAPGGPR